jgi:hypothetical protein
MAGQMQFALIRSGAVWAAAAPYMYDAERVRIERVECPPTVNGRVVTFFEIEVCVPPGQSTTHDPLFQSNNGSERFEYVYDFSQGLTASQTSLDPTGGRVLDAGAQHGGNEKGQGAARFVRD